VVRALLLDFLVSDLLLHPVSHVANCRVKMNLVCCPVI
jgi:hypothetical protein